MQEKLLWLSSREQMMLVEESALHIVLDQSDVPREMQACVRCRVQNHVTCSSADATAGEHWPQANGYGEQVHLQMRLTSSLGEGHLWEQKITGDKVGTTGTTRLEDSRLAFGLELSMLGRFTAGVVEGIISSRKNVLD